VPFIPGSSLLGGLAQAHQELGRPADEFAAFFLNDNVLLSDGYPAAFAKDLTELHDDTAAVLPLPFTARACKRTGGFLFGSDFDGSNRSGVLDGLVPLALFALSGETQVDLLECLREHPETRQPLDRLSGFFRRGRRPFQLGQPHNHEAIRTRVGINYHTGTAQRAILYARQVLQAGSHFWGCWWVDDQLAKTFLQFVEEAADTDSGLLRVGNNRSRGMGRISCTPAHLDTETPDVLADRVRSFTERFRRASEKAGIAVPAALYVPLLLASDTILYDDLLRYRLRLDASDLETVGIPGAELVYHAATWRTVCTWSTYWGLPRADSLAISKGSVFLFALPSDDKTVFMGLHRLQEERLGLRRTEGFGRVEVAHPFHVDLFTDPAEGGVFR
jgi:CRISPR-associated Csx10 family RAMP protein